MCCKYRHNSKYTCIHAREYILNYIILFKKKTEFLCRHDALIYVATNPAHRRARTHIPIVQDGGVGEAYTMPMFLSRFYCRYYFPRYSLNVSLPCERAFRFSHSAS